MGFYNPTPNANNQSACLKCPEHAITLELNSTSIADCLCDRLYYNNDTAGEVQCLRCVVGTDCGAPGSMLSTLHIRPGYYRPSPSSIDVRMCLDAGSNCSGEAVCKDSTSGCAGGSDPASPCQPGLEGKFCSVCAKSNASSALSYYVGGSDAGVAHCSKCPEGVLWLVIGLGSAATAALIVSYATARRAIPKRRRKALYAPWERYGIDTKLKLLIGFYQIGTKIGKLYHVAMPAEVAMVLEALELGISFGLDITTPFECFGANRYEQRLLFWLLLPLVLVLCLLTIGMLRRRFRPQAALQWALPYIFQLMFLLCKPCRELTCETAYSYLRTP